ncbi:MAG: exodeoxyribonuclease VII small subunit [Planctomycetes bacterium]|nr:exodeoxyribonuclease VII small subunit [Planctomycetota bacterium]
MPEPKTFEAALTELDKIVQDLEAGDTGLEQSLARYEQGIALVRRCYEQLRNVEQRIVELTGKDEAGSPVLKPFEHASSMKHSKEAQG